MSYDIFFVRRDPGQTFDDALEELEASFEHGDPGELTDADVENWESIVPRAREILGDLDIDDQDDFSRELTALTSGVELRLIRGEIEIHVPDDRADGDALELMSDVYDLARAVEDLTGLEGYDPQVGEPVSDQPDAGTPSRRRWSERDDDDDEDDLAPPAHLARRRDDDDDLDFEPDVRPRRWWEFWRP